MNQASNSLVVLDNDSSRVNLATLDELNMGFDNHPVQKEAKEPVFPFKKPKYAVKDVET